MGKTLHSDVKGWRRELIKKRVKASTIKLRKLKKIIKNIPPEVRQ